MKNLVLNSSSDKPHALLGTLFPVGFLYGDELILSLDSFAESQEQISCQNSVVKEEQWVGKWSLRAAHQSPSNTALSATGAMPTIGAGWLWCCLSSWGLTAWAEHPVLGREGLSWLLVMRLCLALWSMGLPQGSVKKRISFQLLKQAHTPSPDIHQKKIHLNGACQQKLGRRQGTGSAFPWTPFSLAKRRVRTCCSCQ